MMLTLLMKSRFLAVVLGRAARQLTPAIEADPLNMDTIAQALDARLTAATARQASLKERMEDVLARAAVAAGNSADEFVDRDDDDKERLRGLEMELINGERELKELVAQIGHLQFLKAELIARFPDCKPVKPVRKSTSLTRSWPRLRRQLPHLAEASNRR
ncbi:hypothetical protein Q3C01_28390 [Bradyrhizobium sp. UFLA05-109]